MGVACRVLLALLVQTLRAGVHLGQHLGLRVQHGLLPEDDALIAVSIVLVLIVHHLGGRLVEGHVVALLVDRVRFALVVHN